MEFARLSAPSLKELFISEMESMILSGKLNIGEKLPPERELARQMQVSRAVINSGINDLARKGFLIVKPRAGVYVTDYRRSGTPETMLAIMEYNGGHMQKQEIRSILEIKILFDCLVVEQAIPILTEDNLNALETILEELKKADDPEDAAKLAFEFYHELSLMGTNTLIPLIYQAFRVPNFNLWTKFAKSYGCNKIYTNAEELFLALKSRKVRAAKEIVKQSLNRLIDGDEQIYN